METAKNAAVENSGVRSAENRDLLERTLWPGGERCQLLNIKQIDSLFNSETPRKWLQSIAPYGNTERSMLVYSLNCAENSTVKVKFFTENNEYVITMIDRANNGTKRRGYMGCVVRSRKERPGETWKRGCDLPDGYFEVKTWERIKCAILAHEIKNLQIEL
jgi:hypothetical protein